MRYILLVYTPESEQGRGADPAEAGISAPFLEYNDWLDERRIRVAGERLAASGSATTVRLRDGSRLITDGPFAETKEVLGGYYILECRDLDEALEAAARCPAAMLGSIEVRPIVPQPGMTGPEPAARVPGRAT